MKSRLYVGAIVGHLMNSREELTKFTVVTNTENNIRNILLLLR